MLILKAAKEDDSLIPLLMIQESLVEPKLSLGQIRQLHLGLISYLIAHVRRISGLAEKKARKRDRRVATAASQLSPRKAFGWTPQQVQTLTMAQIDLYLHFLNEDTHAT
ncbi:MAG: hypothetical protein IPK19_10800 [Chloroflexi bacterium]|nr:hypothetical protein [Chloroflexota bacterium]